ncbi:NACHT, LRR and PYD domains-containing protein 3-like [Salminus brasiliensis]|uniref:NACHT, LRR and PYD domains-containing protein 3-like n=1 Tax=Salminus brasiliensis TaxID=930266 RepID=UPI003B839D7A
MWMESKHYMMEHHSSSKRGTSDPRSTDLRRKPAEPPEPSCVSIKSDKSIDNPPVFSSGGGEPSCVSIKSDRSIDNPPVFSSGGEEPSYVSMKSDWSRIKPTSYSFGGAPSDPGQSSTALYTHGLVGGTGPLQQDSQQPVDDVLHRVLKKHKSSMKKKYESLFEGIKTEGNRTLLNRIYTQLYIIEGESEGVNEEHEVLQMEKTPRSHREYTTINCSDILNPLQKHKGLKHKEREDEEPKMPALRSVLTKGIAGIGKTVSVQKFILDWAEGTANQDVDFMFVLSFRELNLIKDHQYSLHGLLCDFHPELKDLDPKIYEEVKTVFIFDGLDESRIPLNFEECEKVSDITMTSSVGVLMTNLIREELLPSALIWITCRPAAVSQIPPKHINRVTEIQGFNDPQKEEYFRKKISDQDQAQKIISHIKTARSLHIMCHIPVFCWISATVLQRIINQHHSEIPKTLTEMYSHFLITQTNTKNQKYEEKDERDPKKLLESNRTELLKLAKLAFKQLMRGNVMFYEEDLRESGIDVTEASVYSGVFTEIFREECVLYQRKVYCFVHLSFQEFLAAVYVFHCYQSEKMEELQCFIQLDDLLKRAVDKAVESQNGHLDLFLRFLLGISLKSNQRLLQGLLTHTHTHSEKTSEYIKKLIKEDNRSLSTERSINLFLCLSEMKDQSLFSEIQEYLNSENHLEVNLSPGQCSALAYMLLTSEEVLEELDLKKYNTSEEGYKRLIPAVTVCRRAVLAGCLLTKDSCGDICSALQSVNSSLKELDLSNNDLQDSGLELLSAGLNSSHCKLESLRLAVCNLGEKSCEALCPTLKSVNSLKELDLSNNDLQDSGVELLSAGLRSSHCKLETLRLSGCMVTEEGCCSLASALKSNPSCLRELDLTYNHPEESGIKLLSNLLEDPHCKLEKLLVDHGGKNRIKPGIKKYFCKLTLDPCTAHTRLSLSEGNRKVEWVKEDQLYPDHTDRFDYWQQVLSVESLTGRCYWEAEWRGVWAEIAVSYRGIKRKGDGDNSRFGRNNQSWSLQHFNDWYIVYHNNKRLCEVPHSHRSGRVGVYLDWPAATLTFYSISPNAYTLTHIHTHHTTFTEPLYTGFRAYESSMCVCEIE